MKVVPNKRQEDGDEQRFEEIGVAGSRRPRIATAGPSNRRPAEVRNREVPVSSDSIQALSPLCARVSSASLAAACSASFLLRALGRGKFAALVPDFDFKGFLCSGPDSLRTRYVGSAEAALLKPFLQGGFVVGALEAFDAAGQSGVEQAAAKKSSSGRQARRRDRWRRRWLRRRRPAAVSFLARRSFPRRAPGANDRRDSSAAPPHGSTRRSPAAPSPWKAVRRPN